MKSNVYAIMPIAGLAILAAGLIGFILFPDLEGMPAGLPGTAVGIGIGIFAGTIGMFLSYRNLETSRRIEIGRKDERVKFINDRAKARSYEFLIFALCVLILAFGLTGSEMHIILAPIIVLIAAVILNAYFIGRYDKEF